VEEHRLGLFSVVEGHAEEWRSVVPASTGDLLNLLLMPGRKVAKPTDPSLSLWVFSVASLAEGQDVPEPVEFTVLT